jgi:hypothetical protein
MRYIRDVPALESAQVLLREARERGALTQAQLAERAGVTQSVVSAYESGRRQPSLPVLLKLLQASGHTLDAMLVPTPGDSVPALAEPIGRRLRHHRHRVRAIAASHGVHRVRVFGSVARGTDGPDSDVDLLIDLPEGMGLFGLGRLRQELEDLLGADVDLVPEAGLKPEVRRHVEVDLMEL